MTRPLSHTTIWLSVYYDKWLFCILLVCSHLGVKGISVQLWCYTWQVCCQSYILSNITSWLSIVCYLINFVFPNEHIKCMSAIIRYNQNFCFSFVSVDRHAIFIHFVPPFFLPNPVSVLEFAITITQLHTVSSPFSPILKSLMHFSNIMNRSGNRISRCLIQC